MPLTDDEKTLFEEIDAAFKNVPHYGKDIGLSDEVIYFVGKTRQEVTAQDIWRNASYLHFFSAKAIRYFLP